MIDGIFKLHPQRLGHSSAIAGAIAKGHDGVRAYYRHCRANLKHNSHCPFVADQQSIGDSSVFAGAKAEQFLLSGGVPSAALQGQSRASAPLPEPHAPCAPRETRRFPVVRWLSPLGVPDAPVCPPTNRENLLPQFSIRFVSNSHRQVPIALASSSAQIPAGWLRCLASDRVRPASDRLAAMAAASLVADKPDNCSIESSPVSSFLTQCQRALDSDARNQ